MKSWRRPGSKRGAAPKDRCWNLNPRPPKSGRGRAQLFYRTVESDFCNPAIREPGQSPRSGREADTTVARLPDAGYQIEEQEGSGARGKAIAIFKVGWDQLASSAGPPSGNIQICWWAGAAKRRWSHSTSCPDFKTRWPWRSRERWLTLIRAVRINRWLRPEVSGVPKLWSV